MSEWQPIETAPKDGARVLVTSYSTANWSDGVDRSYWQTQVAWLVCGEWITESHEDSQYGCVNIPYRNPYANGPTHWMPLPAPPTDEVAT